MKKYIVGIILLSVLTLTGCAFFDVLETGVEKREIETYTFNAPELASADTIRMNLEDSIVCINSWQNDGIYIKADKYCRAGSVSKAAEGVEALTVIMNRTSTGNYTITSEFPFKIDNWTYYDVGVDYTIYIGTNIHADFFLGLDNGQIDIADVTRTEKININAANADIDVASCDMGDLSLTCANGNLDISDSVFQNLYLSFDNGNIDVGLSAIPTSGLLNFNMDNGSIDIAFPDNSSVDANVAVKNGDIDVNNDLGFNSKPERDSTGETFTAQSGNAPYASLRVRLNNGDIDLDSL